MSGEVRNGTIVILMSAVLLNNSAAKFWVLPGLMVATFNFPGFARAALTMSCTDFSGEPALVTISRSKNDTVDVEAKSVRMLYGSTTPLDPALINPKKRKAFTPINTR